MFAEGMICGCGLTPMAQCSVIALQKLTGRIGGALDTSPKATLLWKSFGRNKEGKVFGILSY
jgi:hypothetical protein